MPSLEFKGKSFVYTHHLSVPFRELVVDAKKSLPAKGEKPSLDDNLIIHGDNLHALKALLPVYAGKVDCIFIDPPYNTGNEGWCYNDNVRSPLMKEWLKKEANPVDKEDLERHDKWLCMMWPRLALLRELLADEGAIFVAIDDNEMHHLKAVMDGIFGEENAIGTIVWQHSVQGKNDAKLLSLHHNYLVGYSRMPGFETERLPRNESHNVNYSNPDNDPRGPWRSGDVRSPHLRENLKFDLTAPSGKRIQPPENGWRWSKDTVEEKVKTGEIVFVENDTKIVRKIYLSEQDGRVAESIWFGDEVGTTRQATATVSDIIGESKLSFDTPKPVELVERVIQLVGNKDSIVLDSFAGSGTTAHAVLRANKKDGGRRKFILVETENYADTLTAERVRRVIKGYAFEGTQREELHREPITWTKLKKATDLVEKVGGIEMMAGKRFDRVKATVDDGDLVVTGERDVRQKTDGLGGSFTFATLGPEMSIEALLTDGLPAFDALSKYVFYTATGRTLVDVPKQNSKTFGYIGETESHRVHLLYQPDKAWLRSNDAALTEQVVDDIVATNRTGKKTLVFAAAKFMGQRDLTKRGVDFCQLPYAIHRILGD
jgi:adenine-specific DNA-methyltransferase